MATERTRLIELVMVRYREDHDQDYIYFWVEKHNNDMVSEVFDTEEDALNWYKEIERKMSDSTRSWHLEKKQFR